MWSWNKGETIQGWEKTFDGGEATQGVFTENMIKEKKKK